MTTKNRWSKTTLMFAGTAAWGLLMISCVAVNRAVLAPPNIPGAHYVGTKECAQCHSDQTDHFGSASHARLALSDPKVGDTGCEACHGPGSVHVMAGGGKGNIVNPRKSPETCFQCHLDKRGQFSLPHAHPVLEGHVSCVDCHDVHSGKAIRGTGADLAAQNDTCTKCHTEQKGPFVYEHGAMREGCISCHQPHGSVNEKMLVARDANLCVRCHLMTPTAPNAGQVLIGNDNATGNHNSRLMQGTCWSAGCHEAPHGSNVNNHLRR
jgi:predicted CXXCH cytochrome family protein